VLNQLYGAAVIFGWVFGASLVVWYALKLTMGIRVSEEDEFNGVDMADCGVVAYPEFVGTKGL
jgi:Amt family ammonium transporter